MRNPAHLLLPNQTELHRRDGYDTDELTLESMLALEQQVQTTERIRGRAKLGRFSCVQYTLEVPSEADDDTLEIHVNGLAAAKPSYRGVRKASAQTGQISTSIRPARGTTVNDLMHAKSLLRTEAFASESVFAVMDDIERRFGLSDVKLRSHSMGGRAGVAVAEAVPERIKNLTLVNAAGLEPQSLIAMIARLPAFVNGELIPNMDMLYQEFHEPQVAIDFIRYNLQNPLRTGVETLSICRADIRDRVRQLGARGVAVSIIDAQSDKLVPNKSVEGTLGNDVMYYSMHPNSKIGHLGPQTHPAEMVEEYSRADQAVEARLAQAC
jgi:pimeloyl-ACP methyl ester carboxylesterase